MNPTLIVNQCYKRLPSTMQASPWEVTEHGRKILTTEDELNAYIAAYGEMHIVKCRAALQNFPFEELKNHSYEIFDWGCGQGLAILTLLDMLEDRNLLARLESIYLIEPSIQALQRANNWVNQSVGPGVTVIPINKPIPSDTNTSMSEVKGTKRISINLFSNILDIRTLSLKWLANKTASLASVNYMICVGPQFIQNTNSRLKDFCGYFSPVEYFSKINSYPYSYTSRTHHAYGCETRCFVHKKDSHVNTNYIETATDEIVVDPYDYAAEVYDGVVDEQIIRFYNKLREVGGLSYDVYFRPNINCDIVDFVLISKSKGVLLINVCNDISLLENEYRRVEKIKEYLFSVHLKSIKVDTILNSRTYNCVKTALYFPNHSSQEVEEKINELNKILNAELEEKANYNHKQKDYFAYFLRFTNESDLKVELNAIYSNVFKYDYYNEFVNLISTGWHSYKDGDLNFHLSSRQKDIVRDNSRRLRVKGVAGSGKTQVIANRAVEQHIKTGERVLIITFNLSLMQYIRMRINQVPADFSPNMFEIINYHQFFKSNANLYTSQTVYDFDDSEYFLPYKDGIRKYKSIIIDEVQDFKEEWLKLIINSFLAEDGSVSLFGDGEQNIFARDLEPETKMPPIRDCGFTGPWNKMNERISRRIINPQIALLSSSFANTFISNDNSSIEIQGNIAFEEYYIRYWWGHKDTTAESVAEKIIQTLENCNIIHKDVVVLGETIKLLRDIESAYTRMTQFGCMTNFETAEQYEMIMNSRFSDEIRKKNLNDIRRAAKTHFTTDCNDIKMATIHSFKGWESKTVVLVLQSESQMSLEHDELMVPNNAALIYTALTRSRCNLFIINLGNKVYDKFFRENIVD